MQIYFCCAGPKAKPTFGPQSSILGRFGNQAVGLFDDRLLDVTGLILAEEHLLSDKERRRAERAPANRVGCQIDQPFLDVILLRVNRSISMPDEMNALRKTSRSSVF